MSIHIATVGADTAPVALGFLHALKTHRVRQVVLLPDPNVQPARLRALVSWLSDQDITVEQGAEHLPAATPDLTLNLTGGTKPLAFSLANRYPNAVTYTVDAHGAAMVVHDLKTGTRQAPALKVDDFILLYLSDEILDASGWDYVEGRLPETLRRRTGPADRLLQFPGPQNRHQPARPQPTMLNAWLLVKDGQPALLWEGRSVGRLQGGSLHERLRLLAELTRRALGQLALPLFDLTALAPAKLSPALQQYVEDDLRAAALVPNADWGKSRPAQTPLIAPVAPTPDTALRQVYVALMGAQPMPSIVGLQAQEQAPQATYLLSTPGVATTAHRVQTVLSDTPQVTCAVHTLTIDENNPASVKTALSGIRAAHPHAELTLNLTGGTKALALNALDWSRGQTGTEIELTNGEHVGQRRPHWHLTLARELQVLGFTLESAREVPAVNRATERLAAQAFRQLHSAGVQRQFCAALAAAPVPIAVTPEGSSGLAGEYLVACVLRDQLCAPGAAARARHLVWSARLVSGSGASREVDALAVLNDGRLVLVEVKRDLIGGIEKENEAEHMPGLANTLSGLFAHSMLVGLMHAGRSGHPAFDVVVQALERDAALAPPSPRGPLSLWSLDPQTLSPVIQHFPNDLALFFGP